MAKLPDQYEYIKETFKGYHEALESLGEVARSAGTKVAVVAIPMPDSYPLPETTRKVISDGGGTLIDARNLAGIDSAKHYPDGYHLDRAGAEILTEHLIAKLKPLWWNDGDGE